MPHDHHGACNHHSPKDFGRAFLIGIILNVVFILIEVIWGIRANSLALLADAGHNASDVMALIIAWGASILVKKIPSNKFTYGLRGSSIMASLINAVMLMVVVGGIAWESIERFMNPQESVGIIVIIVAATGVIINGITAWLFVSGSKDDINIKGAYLHMLADALVSLAVVISGIIIYKTGLLWIDPLISLIISIVIIFGTWGLLKESIILSLQAVPSKIDYLEVEKYLSNIDEVAELHDLHIWAMSTTEIASSFHLVVKSSKLGDEFIKNISQKLEHDFKINHTTIQIELGDMDCECSLTSNIDK